MIRSLLLIALMAVLSFAAAPASAPLSVKDGKIVDKNNNPFVLRGMSLFWNKWTEGSKYYVESTVTTLKASPWNANVIRVAAGKDNDVNGNYTDAKNFMDWTWNAGIYVIVDWHSHTLQQNDAESFFDKVASYAKQQGYNHVIYEIFNEPCSGAAGTNCGSAISWSSIKDYSIKVIKKIRAQDNNGLIVVGTPSYSSDIGAAMASPITGDDAKNILYTLHFYTSDPSHDTFKGSLRSAYCQKFPVFATEWGTSKADGGQNKCGAGEEIDWTLTNGWMSLVETLGISWANWSYTDKCESSAALNGGLSNSGKYVQAIMSKRNTGGAIGSANGTNNVNLTQVSVNCGGEAEKGKKVGNVAVNGGVTNAVDFVPDSMIGAKDSVVLNSLYVLQGNSNTFSVGYKLTNLSGTGAYKVRLRYGSTAAATVSLQGDGIEAASAELPSTNGAATWKYSDYIPINITASGSETPIKLTFTGANGFVFVNISATKEGGSPPPLSSSSGGDVSSSSEDPTPIGLPQVVFSNSLNAMQNSVNLQVVREASFQVFDLKGNMVRSLKFTHGNHIVSLAALPKGLYIVKAQFGSQKEVLRVVVR
ncbi:MAG: cellulase family glycosylhydrolase [Fibromonadaceae bacterium]|nr:cellulase family glycosylhydrolase [Fibromonadaceae bacterium]